MEHRLLAPLVYYQANLPTADGLSRRHWSYPEDSVLSLSIKMVNQETSESLLDKLILQIFEEQEDAFSFPLTTMKETRDFVRLLNRQGFTYEMICAEIDEKCDAFRNWRLGGGPDTIGRRTMIRINKPLQEAMLSDGEDEDEETLRNGTTGDKASGGGARRKKSMDGGGRLRRSSRVDSVDGEKKGKGKEEKSEEGATKKADPEKKGEVKGQEETGKVDTKDGKNTVTACDNHSKPSSPNDKVKSENAKVSEKREATEKDSVATTVVAKGATPNNIKTSNDHLSKAGNETVSENSNKPTKQDGVVQAVKKDASKTLETSTELKKKEHEAETGKKELAASTKTNQKEQETRTVTDQKELNKNIETKPKTTAEQKSPGSSSQKPATEDKTESTKKDSKSEKKEQKTSTENMTKEAEIVDKTTTGSLKTPPTKKVASKLRGANPENSPEDVPRSPDQVTTGSKQQSSKQDPSSPTSPTSKLGRPASAGSRQIPEVQTPSDKDKNATPSSPKVKISETVSHPTTKDPQSNAGPPSKGDQKSDPAHKPDEKTVAQNNHKADTQIETKILPDESKISSTGQTDKAVAKTPEKAPAVPSTLTVGTILRSKSEIIESKINETPTGHTRTSSDNTDLSRPTATPVSPKTDLQATKVPPSDATQPTVDENYDSDLDSETVDHSAEDRVLINRLHSLKRNQTKDGPGHLFIFSDTPAATGTGKHRVRIGNSRFPEKRLQQAQLFNPDIRMVTSVAVAMRKDALCRAQEELKSMSLRGKRGWYWGSLEVILKVITDLSVDTEDAIE